MPGGIVAEVFGSGNAKILQPQMNTDEHG